MIHPNSFITRALYGNTWKPTVDSQLFTLHFVVIFKRYQYSNLILIENILCLVHSILLALGPHPLIRLKLIGKNIKFLLYDGTHITFNILLMTLGYFRYKLAKVTFDRTTHTL